MFERLSPASGDPILGLAATFAADPRQDKVNLGIGIYQDDSGRTPVFSAVREAESRRLARGEPKTYLPIDGDPRFNRQVQELTLCGQRNPLIEAGRVCTVQAPGGTGALRLAADFLKRHRGHATVWMSAPTWLNQPPIFEAAGLPVKSYPYYDGDDHGVDFDAMLASLEEIPDGDVILLHACCHNPTGADLSLEQWNAIRELVAGRDLLVVVDFAYQGLGEGLDEDARGLCMMCDDERIEGVFVANSFSKNFGLYNERVGTCSYVGMHRDEVDRVRSHLKVAARTNFSNPPAHGAAIVSEILGDADLRDDWRAELDGMRQRLFAMRRSFVAGMEAAGHDFGFVADQRGMFSFTGLSRRQVARLREDHGVYLVDSGRMNVAGLTQTNLDAVCEAIATVRERRQEEEGE